MFFPRTSSTRPSVTAVSISVFLIFFLYAVIRYVVFRGVAVPHIPLYVNNKAIALASIALIGLSYALGPLTRFFPNAGASLLPLRKAFGLAGFGFGAIHGFISLLLFTPAYYPKFFSANGQMNLIGELSMLFGILALAIFSACAASSLSSVKNSMDPNQWLAIQRSGYLGILLVMAHVFSMGYAGWGDPSHWPGRMLPMSLIAFIIASAVILLRLLVLLFPRRT